MTLFTLYLYRIVNITKPLEGYLYIWSGKIWKVGETIIFGWIRVKADAFDDTSNISKAEFFVDNMSKANDTELPYEWKWKEKMFCSHTLKVVAYDNAGNNASKWKGLYGSFF